MAIYWSPEFEDAPPKREPVSLRQRDDYLQARDRFLEQARRSARTGFWHQEQQHVVLAWHCDERAQGRKPSAPWEL